MDPMLIVLLKLI